MDVSAKTANRYRDLLAGTFMARVLPLWFENVGKRQVKSPKVYLRDSGVLHFLLGLETRRDLVAHPRYGASWEGFALEQTLAAPRRCRRPGTGAPLGGLPGQPRVSAGGAHHRDSADAGSGRGDARSSRSANSVISSRKARRRRHFFRMPSAP